MVKLEENARILYLMLAEMCDVRIKNTMLNFSQEEEKHKEIILGIFKETENDLELNNEVLSLIQPQNLYEISKNSLQKDKDFFVFALNTEKQSIEIYTKILNIFQKNSEEYNLFFDLIEQEKKHMLYILKILHELQ
jgi:rubrerythrin